MARRSDRQIFEELLARFESRLRDVFLDCVADIRDTITLRIVVERLEKGDVNGAIEAMHLDPDAFARLETAFAEAYNSGGQATVGNFPRVIDPDGSRVVFRWGLRNPVAEQWLREHSSRLITRIVEDQRDGIRFILSEGLARGRNPKRTALDVVGRVSRVSNRREGGIIGLTTAQQRYVARAREELSNPARMADYLRRQRRDRRFDRTVAKALRDGKPLPGDVVDRIVGRYSDRLLQLRGEAIGLSETMTALAKSRDDAIRQQIAAGKIDAAAVTKVWKHTPQEHPRHHHRAMNGKSVGIDDQFELPNGVRMSYPHSDDAPADETVFCKCYHTMKIDFFAAVERRFRAGR
ncbi:head morphogenesis protein [Nitratireductor sp. StC3]|uniref:head morphogenesis protein n=1 Tax=Nitratireductor sp. StC3 TaxID=2126741 RepID=UPI000D0D2B1C|nr:head morphogenesis protein [Nitratireductor sp. StC3]PSM18223.1 head morphogenesis protein [Nitratireductor sp. StC3]